MLQFRGLKIRGFSELIAASGILFLASIFANACNLLFVLYMVRRLTHIEYGELNALFSLFMILSLPATTIQTVVTKTVAQFLGRREFGQIKYFLIHFGKRILLADVFFFVIFWLLTPTIGNFLKISYALIIVTGGILCISVISPLAMGVLQGAQRFLAMAINSIFSSVLKLILGIVLVVLGLQVMGALLGIGLAGLLGLILVYFQLPPELLQAKQSLFGELHMKSVYQYSLPVFFSLLGWMGLTNGDVILVKHFFSPEDAGFYSVAQMAGKMILFLPAVVSVILFPKISDAVSQKQPTLPLLKKGLLIIGFLCVALSIFCSLFPAWVLKILTRKEAIQAVRLVPLFCIAMTFYALVNLLMVYNLAIHRFSFTIYLLTISLLQLSLIFIFHPNLSTVLFFLIASSLLLFLLGEWEIVRQEMRT